MSCKVLVICVKEEKYAAAFAGFLMKKKELAFQVQVCNGIMQIQSIMQEHPIDILLVDGNYPAKDREGIKAGNIFILTETAKAETNANETAIYKYQSGESILTEIICKCSGKEEAGSLFLRAGRTRRVRVVGIFSPVHRIGKTAYGLKLGLELAASHNVLYLNMEIYGGIGGHFPEEGHTLADALYYSRQEGKNAGMILSSLVKHMGTLDYLLPVRVSEDIKAVTPDEWAELFRQIEEQSIYEILVLDIDEGLRDVYGLLRMCTEILVPTVDNTEASAKLLQMEAELHLLGYDDVKRKMVRKELAI